MTRSDPSALGAAVRAAARFDRTMVSGADGLLAAIPVGVVLGGGIAAGDAVAGVTMGAGAMLVGTAWRVTGGRPPLGIMALDALTMAISTFAGCVTGSVLWVHLLLLCLWSFMGGLLVGVGNRGGVVGTQAIIAVVVFGRFSEPAPAALGLAGLVLAGGLAQVLFLSIIRWPMPLRMQRRAAAAAYRKLAALAADPDEPSTLPAGTALDEAADSLSSPALLGDAAIMTLRALVTEGQRLRVQLAALHALRRQQQALAAAGGARALLDRVLRDTAAALELAAEAVEGADAAIPELAQRVTAVNDALHEDGDRPAVTGAPSPADATAEHIRRRLAALAGQLRAIGSLAPAAGRGGGLRSRRPLGRTNRPAERIRSYADQLRANVSLQSPAGRHAVRLAVVVPVAALIARELPLTRSYWITVAAATVLRPEFGATFTRGTERALGTCLGVALAGAIAVGLHPAGGVTVALVFVLAWAGYATFPASFAVGFAFITALVVFLLNAVAPDTLATASARLLDTLIGGTFGLLTYALWPTWSHTSAYQSLADLVAAQRAYLDAVLAALTQGRRAREHELRPLSRRARLVRTTAEATVARSLAEPQTRRIDAHQGHGGLGAMRRLVQAAHVLRLDAEDERPRHPLPQLAPLHRALDDLLVAVEASLRARLSDAPPPTTAGESLPDLRGIYEELERSARADPVMRTLLPELDEIVDAANGLASVCGLDAVDDEPGAAPAQPERGRRRIHWRIPGWASWRSST